VPSDATAAAAHRVSACGVTTIVIRGLAPKSDQLTPAHGPHRTAPHPLINNAQSILWTAIQLLLSGFFVNFRDVFNYWITYLRYISATYYRWGDAKEFARRLGRRHTGDCCALVLVLLGVVVLKDHSSPHATPSTTSSSPKPTQTHALPTQTPPKTPPKSHPNPTRGTQTHPNPPKHPPTPPHQPPTPTHPNPTQTPTPTPLQPPPQPPSFEAACINEFQDSVYRCGSTVGFGASGVTDALLLAFPNSNANQRTAAQSLLSPDPKCVLSTTQILTYFQFSRPFWESIVILFSYLIACHILTFVAMLSAARRERR